MLKAGPDANLRDLLRPSGWFYLVLDEREQGMGNVSVLQEKDGSWDVVDLSNAGSPHQR